MQVKLKNALKVSVFSIGATSFVAQVIILREFLAVFQGNELIIGVIMAAWMMLTGIGAYLGRFLKSNTRIDSLIVTLQAIIAFLPFASVLLIRTAKNILFPIGVELGLQEVIIFSFLLLLPYCLLSGFMFTTFCKGFINKDISNSIGKVYFWETIGSIAGGIVFNFVMVFWLPTFQNLFVLLLLNLMSSLVLSFERGKILEKAVIGILLISATGLYSIFDVNEFTIKLAYPNQEIVDERESPYGNLVVTKTGQQINFFENGMALFSTNDVAAREEASHYAMIQHSDPKNVLLISSGVNGVLQEILKYNVERIDYLEINPHLIDLAKLHTKNIPESSKIHIGNKDVRVFLKESNVQYDVILVNTPAPSTAQLNRYFTTEFFRRLYEKMNNNAVLSISLPADPNYLNQESAAVHAILFNTLKRTFKHIEVIPGGRNYFLASNSNLERRIGMLFQNTQIKNDYVNQYYIDDFSNEQRGNIILKQINEEKELINKDFKPVVYFYLLKHWINQFNRNYFYSIAVFAILLLIVLVKLNPVSLGLFTGGFAGSSLEVVVILSFQVVYGYVYNILGVIILAFFIGLAIGVRSYHVLFPQGSFKSFLWVQIILASYAFLLPIILWLANTCSLPVWGIYFLFIAVTLDISMLVGMEFAIASKLKKENQVKYASSIYSADMIGSAVGALLISAFLIPIFGLIYTCISIGLLNLLSATIGYFKRSRYE